MMIVRSCVGVIVLAIAIVACSSSDATAPRKCDNSTVDGRYAVQTNGVTSPGVHVASVGVATFDGQGHVSAVATVSVNGTFSSSAAPAAAPAAPAAYEIDDDCTGVIKNAAGAVIADVAVAESGGELVGLTVAELFAVAITYEKIEGNCSLGTLNGTYSFEQGDAIVRPNVVHAIGTATFDGHGHETEHAFVVSNGVSSVFDEAGSYTLNADCTGIETDPVMGNFAMIVAAHGGHEVLGLSLTAGHSETVHMVHNP